MCQKVDRISACDQGDIEIELFRKKKVKTEHVSLVCVCVCAMSHVSPVLSRLKATTDQLIECVLLKKYTLLASLVGATATRYSDLGPRRREHAAPPRAAHANRRPASGEGARNRGAAARRKAAWFWAREDLRVAFRWRSRFRETLSDGASKRLSRAPPLWPSGSPCFGGAFGSATPTRKVFFFYKPNHDNRKYRALGSCPFNDSSAPRPRVQFSQFKLC